MATRDSAVSPLPISALPGIALVDRLDGAVPAGPAPWASVLLLFCLCALPALWGALLLVTARVAGATHDEFSAHARFLVIFSFAWIAAIECFHVCRSLVTNREHTGATAVLQAVACATLAAWLLLHLLGLQSPGIMPCAIDSAIFFVTSVAIKLLFRAVFDSRRPLTRILVAVAHARPGAVSWTLVRKEVSSHEISGAIRLEEAKGMHLSGRTLSTEDLIYEIRREQFEGVLVSAPSIEMAALSRRIDACGGLAAPVRFVVAARETSFQCDQVLSADCLYLVNTGAAPADSIQYSLLKRAFDIVFSLVALIAGSPLLLLIALALMIGTNGEVFFVQDRVGLNGRIFRMYKFRTMRNVAPADSDTRWAPPRDSHCTAVGKFLRKYSLDEIPQFFNVLMGNMSVVGPRPERPFFVNSFRREIDEYHRRHQLKVGITGWAQVNGLRGDTCIRTRLLYDLYYLQNWGLIFDLKIILLTVICVFMHKDA